MLFMDDFQNVHPTWRPLLKQALETMNASYLDGLKANHHWLPGWQFIFAAFSLPLSTTRYILIGESPYPRPQSANGYAFWDAAVDLLWSQHGLSKAVNKATSLRNLIKMLLHARGDLEHDFSQAAIATLDKSTYVETGTQLFQAFLQQGFLLLNASLVYTAGQVNYHAREWRPFMSSLLKQLVEHCPSAQIVSLGRVAKQIPETAFFPRFESEHPYNVSFITNTHVLDFFRPMNLLASITK